MKEFVAKRVKLTNEHLFSYCPYCVKEFEGNDKITYKDCLPKLVYIKKVYITETENGPMKSWDENYFCEKCGRKNITAEDFRIIYGMKADGERY